MMFPRRSGKRNGKLVFNGYRVWVLEDEKVLAMGGSDNCTIMWNYLMSMNGTYKKLKMISFMSCIL